MNAGIYSGLFAVIVLAAWYVLKGSKKKDEGSGKP